MRTKNNKPLFALFLAFAFGLLLIIGFFLILVMNTNDKKLGEMLRINTDQKYTIFFDDINFKREKYIENYLTLSDGILSRTEELSNKKYLIISGKLAYLYDDGIDVYYYFDNQVFEVFDDEELNNIYLINDQGEILCSYKEVNFSYYFIELRKYISESRTKEIFNAILKTRHGSDEISVNGKKGFIIYKYVDEFQANMIFEYHNIRSAKYDVQIVTYTLVFIVIISIVLLCIYFILYKMIIKKTNDLDIARRNSQNPYTYIIKTNKSGVFTFQNRNFRTDFHGKYKKLSDFELDINTDIDSIVKNQIPFTVKLIDNRSREHYLHFIVVDNVKELVFIGENLSKMHNKTGIESYHKVDELTQVPNKEAFISDIDEHIIDNKKVEKAGVLLLNIKKFNNINNLFGRYFGDKIMMEFVKMLVEIIDDKGKIYRIEGDNYAILINPLENIDECKKMASLIIKRFEKPINFLNNEVVLGCKIGGYLIIKEKYTPAITALEIIDKVSLALKEAKNDKNNDFIMYDSNIETINQKEIQMLDDMGKALKKDEFVMFYQAQYNTKIKKIVGFEALIRWNNPLYRNVSPQKYIKLAEKTGMIVPLGMHIVKEVLRYAKKIVNDIVHVSLNVSPIQLIQSGFVNDFLAEYNKYSFKPGQIAIEITESFLMETLQEVIQKLRIIKENGIKIYMDDFGTGYSSLLYLKDLPIDVVKLDQQFISLIEVDESSKLIVKKIIEVAKGLNLDVVAEGVESESQSKILLENGCDIIQGYLISRPIPELDATALLNNINKQKGVD